MMDKKVMAMEYDNKGRISSVEDANGNVTRYTYDEVGRVKTMQNALGKKMEYTYDSVGNVVTYTYDACQRLKEVWIVNESGVTLAKYTYGLGKAGERTSVTELSNGVETETTYRYDKLNRLVKETVCQRP